VPAPGQWRTRCAFLGLFAACLMVTAPFLAPYHYYPLNLFYAEWAAFAIGLAFMLCVFAAGAGRPVDIPQFTVGLFALVLVIALQQALGYIAYPQVAILGGCYVLWAALLVLAGAQLREQLGEARVLAWLLGALAVGGTLAALAGFVQYYEVETPWGHVVDVQALQVGYMFGTVGQRNTFSDYVSCALVATMVMYGRRSLSMPAALALASLMCAALALAASRSSFLYMLVLVGATAALRGVPAVFRRAWPLTAYALLAFALVQVLSAASGWFNGPQGAPNTPMAHLATEMAGGENYRPLLFQKAWRAFLSAPALGLGFGNLASSMFWQAADLAPPVLPKVIDRHAHNVVLQLLAEFGLAGLAVMAVPALLWLRSQFRPLPPASASAAAERVGAYGVLAVIAVHSMVEFPLWIAHFLGLFAVLVGIESWRPAPVNKARAMRAGVLALVLGGMVIAGKYLRDYRDFEGWYLRLEAKERAGIPATGADLSALMVFHDRSLFAHYIERVASEALPLDRNDLDNRLALNSQVQRAFPVPSLAGRQAVLLAFAGKDEEARRALKAMALLWPDQAAGLLPRLEELEREDAARFSGLARYLRETIAQERRWGTRDH
ncbi:MAG TPA: Wzy polymerase domain-containing protein, partial [Burkholderiales bacterium]|nr:Wzy polymerase domain-containing protein [Burkholderiales bacterium]